MPDSARLEQLTFVAALIYSSSLARPDFAISPMSTWDAVKKADDLIQAAQRYVNDPKRG